MITAPERGRALPPRPLVLRRGAAYPGPAATPAIRPSAPPARPERSAMRSIDVHAHLTPQCFWRATEGTGNWHSITRERNAQGGEVAVVGGRRQALPPKSRWTPEERLAD